MVSAIPELAFPHKFRCASIAWVHRGSRDSVPPEQTQKARRLAVRQGDLGEHPRVTSIFLYYGIQTTSIDHIIEIILD